MLIKRKLLNKINNLHKSILLLGPRQTGKSTLIKSLHPDIEINLADQETYLSYLSDPGLIKKIVSKKQKIFVDEIQRIPSLLNTIQMLIDTNPSLQFFLTGSSARKLKRGNANLLPGRILGYELGPLCVEEVGASFDLNRSLKLGLLPGIYTDSNEKIAKKTLQTYAATYLKEEIQAEALTRNMEGFARFFQIIVSRSGDFVNFNKFSSQAMIERTSAKRYFEILKDTLLIYSIEPFTKSFRRRLVQHPRYYLFDIGVLHGCLNHFNVSQDRIGRAFEHLFIQNLFSTAKACDESIRVSVYRTESGAEVDFIVEKNDTLYAIEIKATKHIRTNHFRGFESFKSFYKKKHHRILVYLGEKTYRQNDIEVCNIQNVFGKMGFDT